MLKKEGKGIKRNPLGRKIGLRREGFEVLDTLRSWRCCMPSILPNLCETRDSLIYQKRVALKTSSK